MNAADLFDDARRLITDRLTARKAVGRQVRILRPVADRATLRELIDRNAPPKPTARALAWEANELEANAQHLRDRDMSALWCGEQDGVIAALDDAAEHVQVLRIAAGIAAADQHRKEGTA